MNSRVISWPDLVDKQNHTIVLVDPEESLVENVVWFCKTSKHEYDVYVYLGSTSDLEYLQSITHRADHVFIADKSQVIISGADNVSRYDSNKLPLEYLTAQDNG